MRASAPAKAILLGEHAVVHGVPAIAVPIPERRTEVDLVETDASREIAIEDARAVDPALAAEMVRLALDSAPTPARGARVRIASTIPVGSGLGSSAALAVALVRACRGGGAGLEPAEAARRANELEKLAHGTPSGIDAAAIAYERPILFRRGAPPEPLRLAAPLRLAVAVLPRTGTTASLVASVRRLRDEKPAVFEQALAAIRAAVEAAIRATTPAVAALENAAKNSPVSPTSLPNATQTIATAISQNREALKTLGVSTPATEAACDAALAAGALAAKLSGAGGGGAILALLGPRTDPDRVLAALRAAGATEAFTTEIA